MPRKISDETKQLMQDLYDTGLSVAEIAIRTDVSYATAYGYTKVKERGFKSLNEYYKHLAKERGFASLTEYYEHLAKEKGFASRTEYNKHLAKEKGFKSLNEYNKHLAKERRFASRTEYEEHLVKERGFASLTEYYEHLAKERQKKPINQELSDLIKTRLAELGKTQSWLAKQLGITEGAVSRYVSRRTTPRKSLQDKLFQALELPYHTLDNLLEDTNPKHPTTS